MADETQESWGVEPWSGTRNFPDLFVLVMLSNVLKTKMRWGGSYIGPSHVIPNECILRGCTCWKLNILRHKPHNQKKYGK